MESLRKLFRKLRFLAWFSLAFALASYVIKPLRSAFWKPADAETVCQAVQRGELAHDRWGNAFVYDGRIAVARSPGPDKQWGTDDDVSVGCAE